MRLRPARASSLSSCRHRLHQLHAVRLGLEALVDLEDRDDVLDVPEVLGRRPPGDGPIHRVLEQDGREDAVALEGRAGDDARAHRVHEVASSRRRRTMRLGNAVQVQGLGRAAAALVQRGDETGFGAELRELLLVRWTWRSSLGTWQGDTFIRPARRRGTSTIALSQRRHRRLRHHGARREHARRAHQHGAAHDADDPDPRIGRVLQVEDLASPASSPPPWHPPRPAILPATPSTMNSAATPWNTTLRLAPSVRSIALS